MRKILVVIALLACTTTSSAQSKLSRAAQQGVDNGFKTCASILDQLVKFMHEDDEAYDHLGVWAEKTPDESVFTTLTAESSGSTTALTSFTAVKNRSGRCDATMTYVAPVPDTSCAKIRDEDLKDDWKFYSDLAGAAIYDDPTSQGSNIVLSPMGPNGCLLVKTVVVYSVEP